MSRPELYISIDVETDGPAPGINSMLSMAAVAFDPKADQSKAGNYGQVDYWYEKIRPIPGAAPNKETMEWWANQSEEARIEVQTNRMYADDAMREFVHWCDGFAGRKLIAVAWPDAFDFGFVNYYCWRFVGRNPLGFAACDIRSYANGLAIRDTYYGLKEREVLAMAGPVDTEGLRDHIALDDAIGQGRLFMTLRNMAARARTEQPVRNWY